jgi:hypothetical protein
MINISRISVILCIFVSFAPPAHAVQPVTPSGETFLFETLGKFKVQVRIKTHEIPIGNPSDGRPEKVETNCTYSRFTCSVVDVLDILINGELLPVPRSSFCDLADLNFIKLQRTKKRYVLTLKGGDASESYIVKIVFNNKRVISRTVLTPLAPNFVIERTIYQEQVVEFD